MSSTGLARYGFDAWWQAEAHAARAAEIDLGRVVAEPRGQWRVATTEGEISARLAGRLRQQGRSEPVLRPAVGDWVILRPAAEGAQERVVERVLPRRSKIARKAPGRIVREQVVAANVDTVIVLSALGRDVNERRLERLCAIAWAGGARPVIVLNKADLCPDRAPYVERAKRSAPAVDVQVVSALTGLGLEALDRYLEPGRTVALLGTSGAGKSTLLNRWLGEQAVATGTLDSAGKGRHTTTARQLWLVPSGAAVLDTPGLREVGLWAGDEGLCAAFADISRLAAACRFADCQHSNEPGCAVIEARSAGTLDPARLEAWRRLCVEQQLIGERVDRDAAQARRTAEKRGARALRSRLRGKGRR